MSTDFRIEGDVLIIKIKGKWSDEQLGQSHSMINNFLKQHGIKNIILDAKDAKLDASTIEIFKATSEHADIFPPGTKHAIILSSGSANFDDILFGQNVAVNRGLKMKTFNDIDSAINWFKKEED
jgi:hypothetical protein